MYARKLLSLVSTAVFAVVMLAGCGGSNFSSAAAKAANKAQSTVVFETDARLTNSLQDALEASADPTAIRQAMVEDDNMDELLKSGYRLDVLTVGGSDGDAAADALAEYIKDIVSGREKEGYISLVKADNGSFYAAILTYRNGGSGGSGGGSGSGGGTTGGGSGEGDDNPGGGDTGDENKPAMLDRIVVRPASTLVYVVGQEFKPEDMVVVAYYTDGTYKTVADYSISCALFGRPNTFKEAGPTQIIVNYQGETAAFSVTVHPLTVDYIEIGGNYKTNYVEGQKFDADGMTVTAYYNDGSYRKLNNSEYEFDNHDNLEPGNQTVTIKYTDDTDKTVTADIPVTVASGDKVKTVIVTNYKKDYYVGDKFDKTEVKVTVILSNGDTKTVDLTDPECKYTISPTVDENNLQNPGKYTIKVTYDGVEAKSTVEFSVTTVVLTDIRVTTDDSFQKEYQVGGSFNPTGMKVYATYNHGTEKEIDLGNDNLKISVEDHNSEKGFMSSGTKTITVSYTEGDVTKTNSDVKVTVNKKEPVLDSISAVLNGEKIYVGDSIADKITVTAHYTEGKKDQKVTDFTVDPANFSTAGEHQVKITYTEGGVEKETTLKVTVTAQYTVKVTWNQSQGSVKINGTEYKDGGKELAFDADTDVTIQAIAASGFEFDKFSGSSIGSSSNNTYTISKLNKDVEIQVNFKQAEPEEPEVKSISISGHEHWFKEYYWCTENFDPTGLKITVKYDNKKTEILTVGKDLNATKLVWDVEEREYLQEYKHNGVQGWYKVTIKITYAEKSDYVTIYLRCDKNGDNGNGKCKFCEYWDGVNETQNHNGKPPHGGK